jgi:hypothetical protein
MKNMPGKVHLVLEGTHETTEEKLIAIGYRYNSKEDLLFCHVTRSRINKAWDTL